MSSIFIVDLLLRRMTTRLQDHLHEWSNFELCTLYLPAPDPAAQLIIKRAFRLESLGKPGKTRSSWPFLGSSFHRPGHPPTAHPPFTKTQTPRHGRGAARRGVWTHQDRRADRLGRASARTPGAPIPFYENFCNRGLVHLLPRLLRPGVVNETKLTGLQ